METVCVQERDREPLASATADVGLECRGSSCHGCGANCVEGIERGGHAVG